MHEVNRPIKYENIFNNLLFQDASGLVNLHLKKDLIERIAVFLIVSPKNTVKLQPVANRKGAHL